MPSERALRGQATALLWATVLVMAGAMALAAIVVWTLVQPQVMPVITKWRVTDATVMMSPMGQLVVEGTFRREYSDTVCSGVSLKFYGSDGQHRTQFDVQALNEHETRPDRIDRPEGSQEFGPMAIDTSSNPDAFILEGRIVHRCFAFGPFDGLRMTSILPEYNYAWLLPRERT